MKRACDAYSPKRDVQTGNLGYDADTKHHIQTERNAFFKGWQEAHDFFNAAPLLPVRHPHDR